MISQNAYRTSKFDGKKAIGGSTRHELHILKREIFKAIANLNPRTPVIP